MDDTKIFHFPSPLAAIEAETKALGFSVASDILTGSLLRTLAATKPGGLFLELGTGTEIATTWILGGMDDTAKLTTIDNDKTLVAIARRHLGHDPRVTFHLTEGATFLAAQQERSFDFIFADTWPGKYDHLDEALRLLKPGGLYIIDDLSPQPSWPAGHAAKVPQLLSTLEQRADLYLTKITWSTGLLIATKRA
jgi:predicted O-methyltransferase YrrM